MKITAVGSKKLINDMIADSLAIDINDRDTLTRHLMLTVAASRIIETHAPVRITPKSPGEVQGAECLIVEVTGPRGVEEIQIDAMGDTFMVSGEQAGRTLHGALKGFPADQGASSVAAFIDGFARAFTNEH